MALGGALPIIFQRWNGIISNFNPHLEELERQCLVINPAQFWLDCSTMHTVITLAQQQGVKILQLLFKLSQTNINPRQSWCDHIIEWNPPHPTTHPKTQTFKAFQNNLGSWFSVYNLILTQLEEEKIGLPDPSQPNLDVT